MAKQEDYIKKVHGVLSQPGTGFKLSEADFRKKVQDPTYVQKVHEVLSQPGTGFELKIDEFSSRLIEKKNPNEKPLASSGQEGSTDGGKFEKPFLQQTVNQRLKDQPVAPKTQVATPTKTLGDYVNPRTMTPGLGDAVQSTGLMAARVAKEFNSKSTTGTLLGNRVQVMDGIAPKSKKPIGDIRKADMGVEKASSIQEQSRIQEEARARQEKENLEQQKADASVSDVISDYVIGQFNPFMKYLPKSFRSGIYSSVSGLSSAVGAVGDIGSRVLDKVGIENEIVNNFSNQLYEAGSFFSDLGRDQMIMSKIDSGIKNPNLSSIDHFINGKVKDGSKVLVKEIAQMIPTLATMYATGAAGSAAAGLGIMGAQSFGSNVEEQRSQYGQVDALGFTTSALKAGLEVITERIFNMDSKAAASILSNLFKKSSSSTIKREVARSVGEIFSQVKKGAVEEGFKEELTAGLGSGVIDLLEKKARGQELTEQDYIDVAKRTANQVVLGSIVGGSMSGMAAAISMKPYTREEKNSISRLEGIVNDPSSSKYSKDAASKMINTIKSSDESNVEETFLKASQMSIEDKVAALSLKAEIEEINAALEDPKNIVIEEQLKRDLAEKELELESIINTPQAQEGQLSSGGQGAVQEVSNNLNNQVDEQTKADVQTQAEAEAEANVLKTGEVDTSPEIVTQGEVVPEAVTQSSPTSEVVAQEELVPDILISDVVDKRVTMNGVNGNLYQDENGLVIFNEDGGRQIEIGNINDISNSAISDFKIETQESVVSADVDGNITVRGESYSNPYSDPTAAINYDNNGNIVSVNMETGNGNKRTFRGNIAEDVAYQIHLKEISKNNERLNDFEEYINSEQGQQEINDGQVQGVAETGTEQSDAVVPEPKVAPVQPTTVKPVTPQDKVNQLRKDEQAEYDALPDPNDEAARKEIYDKYDAKITPLLKEIELLEETNKSTPPPPVVPPIVPLVAPTPSPAPNGGAGNLTPKEANDLSKEMIEEEGEALSAFDERMQKVKSLFLGKKWWDRQGNIRRELKKAGATVTDAFMTNVAGARAAADKAFEIAEKKIYGNKSKTDKMSIEDEKNFDRLLLMERFIQIDSDFDERKISAEARIKQLEADLLTEKNRLKSLGKKPTLKDLKKSEDLAKLIKKEKENIKDRPKHPKGFNKELAELGIEGLKQEVGQEKFDQLNARKNDYFAAFNGILKDQYEAGLINKETYDRFKDKKYVPRWFLKYLLVEPGTNKVNKSAEKTLSKEQIKTIEGGDESLLFSDSRVLLNTALRSSRAKIAQNYANRSVADVIRNNKDMGSIGKEANYSFSKGTIKTDNFGNKVVKEADPGYVNMRFFNEDGTWDAVQIKTELNNEFLDIEQQFDDFNPLLSKILMNGLLKSMATGLNATFFITNVPVDYLNTILFTNTFDDTNIFNAGRKLAKGFTYSAYNYSLMDAGGKADPKFLEDYKEWAENGGMMQFLTDQGRPDQLAKRQAEIRSKKSFQPLNKLGKNAVKTLAYTGELSEKGMRIAVFSATKDKLLKEAGGKGNVSSKEYKEILALAAAASRKTMDFAQGGLFGKKADVFMPYLNARIQGFRVAVEYMKDNPKRFVGKLAQFAVPVAALTMYNLSVMDDDKNELEDIAPRELQNYFIILKPWKNEKGKREYWRVKKVGAIQWFTNAVERSTIQAYRLATGKEVKMKQDFITSEWESFSNALPISLNISGTLASLPALFQAAIAYTANFDLFKDESIVKDKDFGEISPVLEGRFDKEVPLFYKKIAEKTNISPKRAQAGTEKIVTNPQTNGMVGLMYSLLDNAVTAAGGEPKPSIASKYQDVSTKTFTSIFSNRTTREINPNYSDFKDSKSKQRRIDMNSFEKETKVDIRQYVKDKAPLADVQKYIKSLDIATVEKERFALYYKDNLELSKAKNSIPDADLFIDLKYERNPIERANIIFDEYGKVDKEDYIDIVRKSKALGVSKLFGNERFDAEYKRLIEESEKPLKNK